MTDSADANLGKSAESDALREVEARIHAHPGYIEEMRIEAFSQTLNAVFGTNLRMLIQLLRTAKTDVDLQVQLIQNVARPDARNQFNAALILLLHNYVASAMTLTDHAHRMMRGRTGDLGREFSERKAKLLENPEVLFIKGLRNFMLHRSLPFIGYTLNIADPGTDGPPTNLEIELSAAELLAWDGWKAAKPFVKEREPNVALLPIIEIHGDVVFRFNAWIINAVSAANREAVAEMNEIVVERNAVLSGLGVEAARRLTDEVTRQRTENPWPPPKDDLPFGIKLPEPTEGPES